MTFDCRLCFLKDVSLAERVGASGQEGEKCKKQSRILLSRLRVTEGSAPCSPCAGRQCFIHRSASYKM